MQSNLASFLHGGLMFKLRLNAAITLIAAILSLGSFVSIARAQCTEAHWLEGNGTPGVVGTVNAVGSWDPDGAGPIAPYPILGGSFSVPYASTAIGSPINIRNLVAWNGGRFIPLAANGVDPATAFTGGVNAILTLPSGDLIVGGSVTNAGGVAVANIARWNGTTWFPLGSGLNGLVTALAAMPNGDVLAAGNFTMSGATTVGRLARWNGTTWSAYGTNAPSSITALAVLGNGSVVIGGNFNTPANGLARWTGSAWASYPLGVNSPQTITAVPNTQDQFIVGGSFYDFFGGPLNMVAFWNGSAWAALGSGLGNNNGSEVINTIAVRPNGEIVVGGQFTNARAFGTTPANPNVTYIATWNGITWSTMGGGATSGASGPVYGLRVLPNGNVIAGGLSGTFGPLAANFVAEWNGSTWSTYGNANSGIYDFLQAPSGDVYAAGAFIDAGGVIVNRIARWDNSRWNAVGQGFNNLAYCVAVLPNNDVVVGGTFTMIGASAPQTPAGRIARWNGTTWDNMGGGSLSAGTSITDLVVRPNGDLVAVGSFTAISGVTASGVARWNANDGWISMASGPNGLLNVALAMPNGDVIVGGSFSVLGGVSAGNLARWNPIFGWSAFISGTQNGPGGTVYGLARAANGDILAAGDFTQLSPVTRRARIARWNGSTWTLIGNDVISGVANGYAVIERPDGTIVAGGNFTAMTGITANNIASWNGSAWTPMEDGIGGQVRTLLQHSNGELWAGGLFNFANRIPAVGWARWACADQTCPTDLDNGSGTGTPDNAVTIDDLLFFLVKFEVGDASVDLDNGSGAGTPDGAVTIDDLLFFLIRFEEGC